jgi:glucosylceramidase
MTASRREFMKLAGSASAATAMRPLSGWALPSSLPGRVQAWRTTSQQRCQPVPVPSWQAGVPVSPLAISLDPAERFQDVLGFGAALTDASCYLISQMQAAGRQSLLDECFGANGLRFSVARTTIGSSDYSRSAYSYDDALEPDPELTHFSIDHDRAYILPTLVEARKSNSSLFYFSSPWSPPAWMKASHTLLGGAMRKHYFPAYAQYFVKFLKGYAAAGIPVQAVTVQNEVDTDQDGRMPQALWGQEYEADFVKLHLGPALQQASLDTKIWILDHNYNLWGRVADELSDPGVYRYVDGVAWHGYGGSPAAMTRIHDMFPAKNAYWTEGGPAIDSPGYGTDWARWSGTFTGILRNWARCIVSWNLLLDQNGKPNIGPFACGGVLTLNSNSHELSRSGQYWAFAHYSKFIDRGARIFASAGEIPGVEHVAAENPNGRRVLVLTNRAAEGSQGQQVQCTLADQSLSLDLPPNSITTLVW